MPASGPGWSSILSGTTVSPVSAKRSGSPLALMMMPAVCADRVASTRSRMVTPPSSMRALSPPPMRRARPPASTRPRVGGYGCVIFFCFSRAQRGTKWCAADPGSRLADYESWVPDLRCIAARRAASGREAEASILHRGLAAVLRAFLLDEGEVLIEHDAAFAGEGDETLAARAADQRQVRLARQFDAPGREARARNEDRNAHAHGFDHHLRSETAGGVEDLVGGRHLLFEHPAGDLVDGVMAADVLHVDQRLVFMRQHAAVDGARLKIERRRGVDRVRQAVEPRRTQFGIRQRDVL